MADIAARIIRAVGFVAAAWLVIGALLYVLEANSENALVDVVLDVARWLATPFRGIFDIDENKAQVILNWGIGAAVYATAAMLVAAGVERLGARAAERGDDRDGDGSTDG